MKRVLSCILFLIIAINLQMFILAADGRVAMYDLNQLLIFLAGSTVE